MSDNPQAKQDHADSTLGAGVRQAATLAMLALIAGGMGALLGALLAPDVEGLAKMATYAYLSLMVIGPLFLLAMNSPEPGDESRKLYATLGGSVVLLLVAGLGGSVAGAAFFFVPATNIASWLGVAKPDVVQDALFAQIGWSKIVLTVTVTSVLALALAWRAHRLVQRA